MSFGKHVAKDDLNPQKTAWKTLRPNYAVSEFRLLAVSLHAPLSLSKPHPLWNWACAGELTCRGWCRPLLCPMQLHR